MATMERRILSQWPIKRPNLYLHPDPMKDNCERELQNYFPIVLSGKFSALTAVSEFFPDLFLELFPESFHESSLKITTSVLLH